MSIIDDWLAVIIVVVDCSCVDGVIVAVTSDDVAAVVVVCTAIKLAGGSIIGIW